MTISAGESLEQDEPLVRQFASNQLENQAPWSLQFLKDLVVSDSPDIY
jgi:hypothetical protein